MASGLNFDALLDPSVAAPQDEELSPFGTQQLQQAGLDFSGLQEMTKPVPDKIAFPRSLKWAYGIDSDESYRKYLEQVISSGREDEEAELQRQYKRTEDETHKKSAIDRILQDRAKMGGMRFQDIRAVQQIQNTDLQDSEDFFAYNYAQKVVNSTASHLYSQRPMEEWDHELMNRATKSIYLKEATQKIAEKMQTDYQASGFGNKAVSFGERFIPLLFDARMKSQFFSLTGNDLMEQYQRYFLMDNPHEAVREIKALTEQMYKRNPEAAIQFLNGFTNYTTSDATLDNLFSAIDFAAPATGLTAGYIVSRVKGAIQAAGTKTPDLVKQMEAAGQINDATKIVAAEQAAKAANPKPALGQVPGTQLEDSLKELRNETVTLQQGVQALEQGVPYTERYRRLAEEMRARTDLAMDQVRHGPVKVQRLEQESRALALGAEETDKIIYTKYPNAADRVYDVRVSNLDDGITSNYFRIVELGQKGDPRTPTVLMDALTPPGLKEQSLRAANQNVSDAMLKAAKTLQPGQAQYFNRLINRIESAFAKGDDTLANQLLAKANQYYKKNTGLNLEQFQVTQTPKAKPTRINSADMAAANVNKPFTKAEQTVMGGMKGLTLDERINTIVQLRKDRVTASLADDTLKPFVTEANAHYSAQREIGLHPKGYQVVPRDGGFVIEIKQPISETTVTVRNELGIETKHDNPPGLLRLFTSLLPLSKDSKLAANMMESAKLAGYGTKAQQDLVREFLKPVHELQGALSKKDWKTFIGFLNDQKLYKKGDEYGRFSRSYGEFVQDYQKYTGRIPTVAEERAYWAYVQLNDLDFVINNLGLARDKWRDGRELFGLRIGNAAAKDVVNNIEGKVLLSLPSDSKVPFGYLLHEKGEGKFYRSDQSVKGRGKFQATIRREVAEGRLKVIQIAPESRQILKDYYGLDMPKTSVNYIITDEIHSQPIPFRNLPYMPGGHRTYDHPWVARVPDLVESGEVRKTTFYNGDKNHTFFSNEKDGKHYVENFNKARELLVDGIASGDMTRLTAFLAKNLGHSTERFIKFFDGYGGQLPLNQPMYLTPSGTSVDSKYKLVDQLKSQYPLRDFVRSGESPHNINNGQINLRYAEERGDPLNFFEVQGNKRNPTYNFRPAAFVDPFVAAHRAADTIVNSRILDDVRIKAVERFIAEFGQGLEWDIARQRANPLQAFLEAPVRSNATLAERLAISDARRATKELIGMKTYFENGIDALQQKIYEGMGFKGNKDGHIDNWMLWTIKNPAQAMRTIAFNLKLGMFNPASFYNQAQALNGMAAILGPTHALKAATASTQTYLLRSWKDNPKMLDAFARNLEAGGMWKADQFKEAAEAFYRTRYSEVGKEVSDWNQWLNPGLTTNKGGQVMESSRWFFKRGEEVGRYNSWFGAYSEWRAANPTAKFGSAEIAQVLNRADTLNLSMSGVSNSVLQKGMPGVMTQFFHAHLRQAELLASGTFGAGRISGAQAARLVTWNSMVYGLPVGLGGAVTAGLWPVKSAVNRELIERNIDPTDHVAYDAIMNGLVSVAYERSTGTRLDFGGSGLGGISLLRDLAEGEKSYWDIFSGAGGRTMKGVMQSFYPVYDFVKSTGERPLTQADFSDILENVSSLNALQKVWYGYTLGVYLGRYENRLENISGAQALMVALTGMQPQSIQDMYDVNAIIKAKEAGQKESLKKYNLHIRRAFEALDKNDDAGFTTHFDRANREAVIGGFRQDELAKMMRNALQDNEPLVVRSHKRLMDRIKTEDQFEYYKKFLEKRGL
jgi:hypothetical protein